MVGYQSAEHLRRKRERELFGVVTRVVEKKQESDVRTSMSNAKIISPVN